MDSRLIDVDPTSKPTEAELFEMETPKVGVSLSESLNAHSTTPPPLLEDCPSILSDYEDSGTKAEQVSLRSKLELATYEYAALEERHRTLQDQHGDLGRLASDYYDVIRGLSASEDQVASIEQLRAEAGQEGLRAKALEADVFRPVVQALRSLIEREGGLEVLQGQASEADMIRSKVDEVGGPQALSDLVSEVKLLRQKQQEHIELNCTIDELNEFRVKAAKYEKLEQAFNEISNKAQTYATSTSSLLRASQSSTTQKLMMPPTQGNQQQPRSTGISSTMSAPINPARASSIYATPMGDDPDRDLYEPRVPVTTQTQRTGSNTLPLGRPRPAATSVDNSSRRTTLKRKDHDEIPTYSAKRPRVDVGRTSTLVKTVLPGPSTKRLDLATDDWRLARALNMGYNRESSRGGHVQSPFAPRPLISGGMTAPVYSVSRTRGNGRLERYASLSPPISSLHLPGSPIIKTEIDEDERINFPAVPKLAVSLPIALWIGAADPQSISPSSALKTAGDIPSSLAKFLLGEFTKWINKGNNTVWSSMPLNRGACIIGYPRPCALLQEVQGVRTIVFLPLLDELRRGISWKDERYWVVGGC
ncbi:hypothetical protein N0V83_002417 [Neocucurbitaria cava]|uniref:Uncharacterized protein n=1 Tax=Neocucurbitaria cava TaxID=798079 RepID=A0A9W8YEN5_9PLEO|nr:hypothetical protein N0V83_002417 [Neocucurbitaria cava]